MPPPPKNPLDEVLDVDLDLDAVGDDDDALELFSEPEADDEADLHVASVVQPAPLAAEPQLPTSVTPEPPTPSETHAITPSEAQRPKVVFSPLPAPTVARPLRVIAVGGARGGVGKTILAANLGLYLANIGRKVVLVDADASGANLHTCLGTTAATPFNKLRRAGRSDAPRAGAALGEALQESPFRGLQLLHLGLDEPGGSQARGDRVAKLMSGLRELDADYVVVDLGVGLSREAIDNFLGADLSLFVTVPEPTAIESTYRFMRGAFARHLLHAAPDEDSRVELERRLRALGGAPSPLELLSELEQEGHLLADMVRNAIERFRPHVVINQTRLRADLELGFAMQSAMRRRLGITLDYVGHIDHDDTVWTCIRNRRPLLLEVPGAKSSRKIERIARHVLTLDAGKAAPQRLTGVPKGGHHDLLEIERGASDEDIRRAYKRCREVYAHDSLCCYGLFEPHEIEKLRARLDEAFDVLVDPARRRPYELSAFPDQPEPMPAQRPDAREEEPARPPPELSPDTQFTGAILRQVRESQRVTLHELTLRTKITTTYLKAIEDDDFARLPELVYTGGFLRELARCLKLDAQQVSRTYVGRYKRYLEERERAFARKQ